MIVIIIEWTYKCVWLIEKYTWSWIEKYIWLKIPIKLHMIYIVDVDKPLIYCIFYLVRSLMTYNGLHY